MEKKDMKKRVIIAAVAVVWLAGCWIIGHTVNKKDIDGASGNGQSSVSSAGSEVSADSNANIDILLAAIEEGSANITGYMETSDYPYGHNAGMIEDDEVGKAILVTPGASVEIPVIREDKNVLSFECLIHPWVSKDSDGCSLLLSVTDDENIHEYKYELDSESQKVAVPIEEFTGEILLLTFSVVNDDGATEACDWAIVRESRIE